MSLGFSVSKEINELKVLVNKLNPSFNDSLNYVLKLLITQEFCLILAPGKNVINRNAVDSSVTLSHTYSFDELREGKSGSTDATEYCSCGWPEHMLLPRGTHKGMDYELFIMLTDYTVDNPEGANVKTICNDAVSYCGAKDQKYPDKKPMGFPFDRPVTARTAAELLTDNMTITDVKIKFLG